MGDGYVAFAGPKGVGFDGESEVGTVGKRGVFELQLELARGVCCRVGERKFACR